MHHHKLFNDKSKLYKSARPLYPTGIYEHFSQHCQSTDLVWDCACGNGQAAESLAKFFDKVIATDISEQQIRNAIKKPNIEYLVSSAEKTIFPNDSFDLVCVAQALHWFDFELFWPEVQRVLKRNGIFATWGYTWPSIAPDIDAAFSEYILKVIEPFWASQNRVLWNHYQNIDFPFEKIDSPQFIMQVEWNLDQFFIFIHTFSATRRCMENNGSEFFNRAYSMILQEWGNVQEVKTVSLDFILYVGKMKTLPYNQPAKS